MFRQLNSGRLAFAAGAAIVGIVLAGCTSTISGTALPADGGGTIDAVDTTTTPSSEPTTSAPETSSIDFDAQIGDCVAVGGTVDDATIEKASCGSSPANYEVIGFAPTSTDCIADRDNFYAETLNGVEQGAVCLDIDWVIDGCMEFGLDDPQHIDCATPGIDVVRVLKVVEGTTAASACDTGTGFRYTTRNFVVCIEEL